MFFNLNIIQMNRQLVSSKRQFSVISEINIDEDSENDAKSQNSPTFKESHKSPSAPTFKVTQKSPGAPTFNEIKSQEPKCTTFKDGQKWKGSRTNYSYLPKVYIVYLRSDHEQCSIRDGAIHYIQPTLSRRTLTQLERIRGVFHKENLGKNLS